jgi:hypothetical protein
MAWLSDYQSALRKEIERVEVDIVTGGCVPADHYFDTGAVAVAYRARVSFLAGLQRAEQILNEIEKIEIAA